MESPRRVDFFHDFISPYAYLASTQIDALCARHGASVRWRPFLLGAVFVATDNRSPIENPRKYAYLVKDVQRFRAYYGIEGLMPSSFPVNSIKALRAALAVERLDDTRHVAFSKALYRAHWVDDRDISDAAVIADVADGLGLDGATLVAATADPPIKQALRDNTDAALEAGAFGAPSMLLDGELYWGNDRLPQLEWALQYR